jgi:amino acid adenylation domain-containing protein
MFCQNPLARQVYSMPRVFEIQGPLDVERLRSAVNRTVERHQALRTVFPNVSGAPVQRIQPASQYDIPVVDVPALEVEAWIAAEIARPLDLAAGPLFRCTIARLHDDRHVLLQVWHHLISDARSAEILDEEISRFYRGESLPSPPLQFGDFAEWESNRFEGCDSGTAQKFWRDELGGCPPCIDLPFDDPRPSAPSYTGALLTFDVDPTLTRRIREFCAGHQVAPFSYFLAAYTAVLSRYSGQSDVVVGVPMSLRSQSELDRTIGFFVNMLPLRLTVDPDSTFPDLVRECRARYAACAGHPLPLEYILNAAAPSRSASYSPLFQVALNYLRETDLGETDLRQANARLRLAGTVVNRRAIHNGTSMYELSLTVSEHPDQTQFSIEYRSALFGSKFVRRMAEHFVRAMEQTGSPGQPAAGAHRAVGEQNWMGEEEVSSIIHERNATYQALPEQETFLDSFNRQVAELPHKPAVLSGRARRTYSELSAFAWRVREGLLANGVRPGDVIAVHADRTVDIVGAALGVWMSGGVWLPIDPRWPEERAQFVIADSGAKLAVNTEWLRRPLPAAARAAASPVSPDAIAYILYTSGSTGKPKGVAIRHRSLLNFLHHMRREPGVSREDLFLSVTPLTFDISLAELLLPLTCGATLILPGLAEATDPFRVRALLESHDVTVMQATPTMWRALLKAGWKPATARLRAWCGGEAMDTGLSEALLDRTSELWNLYGPTETTIWSTAHRVARGDAPVPIGRPIANTQCYVLDDRLQPVPDGVRGELFIGGAGVSPGYVGHAQEQNERFLENPFVPGSKMYRTGDLVRWSRAGHLGFLSRKDAQIKVRGHRIELQEVEAALARLSTVRQAAAAVRDGALIAWVVLSGGDSWVTRQARRELRAILPEYMIPRQFHVVDHIPLNFAGKVDRDRLPLPDAQQADRLASDSEDPAQSALQRIWRDILGRADITVDDDFFDLGGDSLRATEMIARVELEFGTRLSLAALFRYPTIAALSGSVFSQSTQEPIALASPASAVDMDSPGSLPAFFCVNALPSMRGLGKWLKKDRRVLSVYLSWEEVPGLDPRERLLNGVASIVDVIREVQPKGPYFIAGWCTSGVLAWEVAQRLNDLGEEVASVFLLDTHNPAQPSRRSEYFVNRVRFHLRSAARLGVREGSKYFHARLLGMVSGAWVSGEWFGRKLFKVGGDPAPRSPQPASILSAVESWKPAPFHGRVVLFRCQESAGRYRRDGSYGWAGAAEKLEIVDVPGGHITMFQPPNIEIFARKLDSYLD